MRGFTLMELLVVAAIIAILASLLVPVFGKVRERGRQAACINNQRQIAAAMTIWMQDHGDVYPEATTVWQDLHLPAELITCPTQRNDILEASKHPEAEVIPVGYVYSRFIAGHSSGEIASSVLEICTADGLNHPAEVHGVRAENLLSLPVDLDFRHNKALLAGFCDGHVEMLREPPPMWMVELGSLAEFESEVLSSKYPSLVCFYADPAGHTPEARFSKALEPLLVSIARDFRLRAHVVRVDGEKFRRLAQEYDIQAGDRQRGLPALLFFHHGKVESRLTGYPAVGVGWDDIAWQAHATITRSTIVEKLQALTPSAP